MERAGKFLKWATFIKVFRIKGKNFNHQSHLESFSHLTNMGQMLTVCHVLYLALRLRIKMLLVLTSLCSLVVMTHTGIITYFYKHFF